MLFGSLSNRSSPIVWLRGLAPNQNYSDWNKLPKWRGRRLSIQLKEVDWSDRFDRNVVRILATDDYDTPSFSLLCCGSHAVLDI